MKVPQIDLASPDYAEAIYKFCNDVEVRADYNDKRSRSIGGLSLAEYVQKYRYNEFCFWHWLTYVVDK